MQFGRIHGIALAVFGALLLGFQIMLYVTAQQRVVPFPAGSATPRAEQMTNPLPGILGLASLVAGVLIFVTRRKADEPEAKNAVR